MNEAHGLSSRSEYLPVRAAAAGLVVTLLARAWAPLTIARRRDAKTNPGLTARTSAVFATIFSSFRTDGVFLATGRNSPRSDPIHADAASDRFFVAETTVSTIAGDQSRPMRPFGRPNID
jgi:hypothetical protein